MNFRISFEGVNLGNGKWDRKSLSVGLSLGEWEN